jgi:TonB family protein
MPGLSQRRRFTLDVSFAAIVCLMALTASWAQQSNAGASGGRLFVPGSVMAGYCTTMVSPNYPLDASEESSPAVVTLRATIRKSGTVSPISIVSGPHELGSAAMDAVRLWRYRPYMKNQEPVDVTTEILVEFYPGRLGGVITHPAK